MTQRTESTPATITPFSYADHQVRVVTIDGEPWFVLTDLCKVLDIKQFRTDRLDDGMIQNHPLQTAGGRQSVLIVSEPGMYEVVIRSDKPEAASFRRWITTEVLPSIRKHGGYLTPAKIEEVLADPDTIIRLATDLKAERARRAELEAQAEADKPKVLFADSVASSDDCILIRELAKLIGQNGIDIGGNRLFAILRDHGYLIKSGSDRNSPTQKARELGLFRVVETSIIRPDGTVMVKRTTKVTGKGQQYFVERFLDGRLKAAA